MGLEVFVMTPADQVLETQIAVVAERLVSWASKTEQSLLFAELRDLIGQRSPERIAEMERERGLR